MGINVRCDHCGKLVEVDPATGRLRRARCPVCGARLSMPAVLEELPRPQIPAAAVPAGQRGDPPPPTPAHAPAPAHHAASPWREDEHAEAMPHHQHARPLVAMLAGAMPWLLSLCLHAGALLILLFGLIMGPVISEKVRAATGQDSADTILPMDPPADPLNSPTPDKNLGDLSNLAPPKPNLDPLLPPVPDTVWTPPSQAPKAAPGEDDSTIGGLTPDSIFGPKGTGKTGKKGDFKLTNSDPTVSGPVFSGPPRGSRGGGAYYVIFVIDKSGSVVGSFDEIRSQLIESICRLNKPQQFHVIFFSGDKCEQLPPKRLVTATIESKRAVVQALGAVQATGFGSSPIPALEAAFRAFRNTPDNRAKVLFLLTDGEFDSSGYEYRGRDGKPLMGNQAVIQWLHANNKDAGVLVYPIIVGPKPSADTEASMKLLAKENNGRYRYVSNTN
jgi:hypothetical protein